MALKRAPISWTHSRGLRAKVRLAHFLLVPIVGVITGCSSLWLGDPATPVENRDLETLNAIVSEVLFEKNTDTYRLPMPTDAEGINLFHSAIDRLEAWRTRNPGHSEDIVYYTEGLCYEKLGQLFNALDTYRLVRTSDQDLSRTVKERTATLEEIASYFPNAESTRGTFENDRSEDAIEQFEGTEWEPLVWILAENVAVRSALEKRDSASEVASTAYRDALEGLILKFEESARVYEHWMRLGLYHENVAREWITVGEYGNNEKAWELADKALQKTSEIYLRVSQADGYPEKREAQAKLVTLEELSRKIERHLAR